VKNCIREGGKRKGIDSSPLRSEVAREIKGVASGKSTRPDEVQAELFTHAGEGTLDKMHRKCTAVWETGEWPDDWTNSYFIPIPKKGDLGQCKNYRAIALVSHGSKIMLKIILERIRKKTESELTDEQAGFRREEEHTTRMLMQKMNEHQQPLYMCLGTSQKCLII